MDDRVNVRFPKRNGITHESRQENAHGGTTRCGVTFYWKGVVPYNDPTMYPTAELVLEDAECDCMACIAAVGTWTYQFPWDGSEPLP